MTVLVPILLIAFVILLTGLMFYFVYYIIRTIGDDIGEVICKIIDNSEE